MSLYVVRSRFQADGEERRAGEIVDAGQWQHRDVLLEQGRLERDPEQVDRTACECGREWQNPAFAEHCPTPDCGGPVAETEEEPEEEDDEQDAPDLDGKTKAELQEVADDMGLEPEGTGANGNVLKDDLKRAIREAHE